MQIVKWNWMKEILMMKLYYVLYMMAKQEIVDFSIHDNVAGPSQLKKKKGKTDSSPQGFDISNWKEGITLWHHFHHLLRNLDFRLLPQIM